MIMINTSTGMWIYGWTEPILYIKCTCLLISSVLLFLVLEFTHLATKSLSYTVIYTTLLHFPAVTIYPHLVHSCRNLSPHFPPFTDIFPTAVTYLVYVNVHTCTHLYYVPFWRKSIHFKQMVPEQDIQIDFKYMRIYDTAMSF